MKVFAWACLCGCVLIVTGCSSGGGGTGPATSAPTNTSNSSTNTAPATITIGAAGTISMGTNAPLFATGTTPNFMSNPPSAATVFPVNQTVLAVTPTTVSDAN